MLAAILLITCGACIITCCNNDDETVLAPTDDSSQFVTLTDVVPDAILEIRYFGTYNFVGTRIDGYEEPTALMTKQAAQALKRVSDDVRKLGYRLKIYDHTSSDHPFHQAFMIPGNADLSVIGNAINEFQDLL